jgi:large subunit ribosomal protein L10
MALSLAGKKQVVEEVSKGALNALSALVADYRGLTVTEMTDLRAKAREAGVFLRVARNTLAKRALKETEFECLEESLVGPLCIAFSYNAPSDAARLLRDYIKVNEKLEVKAIALGGKLLDPSQLNTVANLPTKDEAIAKLLYVMKAPVEKFVRTLAEPHGKLVRTIAAIKDQKQCA